MPRKPSDGADRQSINVRTRVDLKQRLERIAAVNGRSLAQEVERRLEQSLEEKSVSRLGDAVLSAFPGEDYLRYLVNNKSVLQYLAVISEVFMRITRLASENSMSEDATRIALREAVVFLTSSFLWRGEDITRADIPRGSRLAEQSPAEIGRKLAEDFMIYRSAFFDGGALEDTFAGRIMNVYSGDGHTQISPTQGEADTE